jgi:hypothetical protein
MSVKLLGIIRVGSVVTDLLWNYMYTSSEPMTQLREKFFTNPA